MSTLLKVKNIKKDNILNSVSFEMMSGEMIAIMGPSGSGKSTLLYNISGMDQADGGEVWLGDTFLYEHPTFSILTKSERANDG